jgi:HSP20 family protein
MGTAERTKSSKGGMDMLELMPWKKREQNDLVNLRRNFEDLSNRFFDRNYWAPGELFKEDRLLPSIDISEGRKDITVKAEIPGVEANDIDINNACLNIERSIVS